MRPILTIVLNDLHIYFSQRGNLIGLLVIPVLLTLVLGYSLGGSGGGQTRLRVDLIDQDQTEMSAQLIDALRAANDTLVLCPYDNDADDYCRLEEGTLHLESAIDRARAQRTAALIVIPAGYAAALENFHSARIDYYSTADPLQPGPVLQSLNAVLQRVNSASMTRGVVGAVLENVTTATELPALDADTRAGFLHSLYLRAQEMLSERPARGALHRVRLCRRERRRL